MEKDKKNVCKLTHPPGSPGDTKLKIPATGCKLFEMGPSSIQRREDANTRRQRKKKERKLTYLSSMINIDIIAHLGAVNFLVKKSCSVVLIFKFAFKLSFKS